MRVAYQFSRQPFFYAVRYSFPLFFIFPHNRKTRRTEVLRASYAWTQSTLRYSIYLYRSANLDFATLHLGRGVRPINSTINVLVWASSHRPLLYEFALLITYQKLFDNGSNTAWSNSTSTFTISDWRIAVCKWWFFVWFVGESPDFPLYPCGFWGFCYHSVITAFLYQQIFDFLI